MTNKELSSRAKAKRAELSLAHLLQKEGVDAKRVSHSTKNRTSDLEGMDGIHINAVCRSQRIDIWKELNQSLVDTITEGKGDIPAVFFKRQNPSTEWYVALPLKDFLDIYNKGGKDNE